MNIFGNSLLIPSFLAGTLLVSCSSGQSTPTVSDAEIMETARATVSTVFAETQRAVPTNTPLPTFSFPTTTPTLPTIAATPIPAFTKTPTLLPASVEPYAVVSSNKAEFWFPLPDRQEWEWGLQEHSGGEYGWGIRFGTPQDYGHIAIRCGYSKPEASQTGSFEDMLKTCGSLIRTSPNADFTSGEDVNTSSYSNGGLLIQLTDPCRIKKLIRDQPPSMLFQTFQTSKVMPSKTPPLYPGSYAVILPDKAKFWFHLPDKTDWVWNHPLASIDMYYSEYFWGIYFGTYIVQIECRRDGSKSAQTGSFEDLLETCAAYYSDTMPPPASSISYTNGGLLIQLTDPEAVEFLNKTQSQAILFKTYEPFVVTPTYK